MNRKLLWVIAIGLWIFYTYCFIQWLQSGHNFNDVWQAASSDWFLKVTLFDTCLFTIFCFIWMINDMRKLHYRTGKIVLAVVLTFLFGAAGFIGYLAARKRQVDY